MKRRSAGQWTAHPAGGVHPRGGPDLGRGLQGTHQAVPDPRLQGVPEEPAVTLQTLRLQGGQCPAAGGRLALPQRSDGLPVTILRLTSDLRQREVRYDPSNP